MTKRDEALRALKEATKVTDAWTVLSDSRGWVSGMIAEAIASLESGGGEGVGLSVGDLHVIYRTAAYTKHQELFKGAPFPASSPQHIAGIEAIASRLAQSPQVVSVEEIQAAMVKRAGFVHSNPITRAIPVLAEAVYQLQLTQPAKIEGGDNRNVVSEEVKDIAKAIDLCVEDISNSMDWQETANLRDTLKDISSRLRSLSPTSQTGNVGVE